MSVVTKADFEERFPEWVSDPEIGDEIKTQLIELGLGGSFSVSECMEINDLCFCCGEHLSFPYVYWHGSHGDINGKARGISLHPNCALALARGITKDALRIGMEDAK
jgi:hypothetical protein